MDGDGFHLTSPDEGVYFDFMFGLQKVSWTTADSRDAWLAMDWNHNGTIDDASELFGNLTPQEDAIDLNGFLALAMYDSNEDGVLDDQDPAFGQLLLWIDANHDGASQAAELHALDWAEITALHLDYERASRKDRWGNQFRYRAKSSAGTWGPLRTMSI